LSKRFDLHEKESLEAWNQSKLLTYAYPEKNKSQLFELALKIQDIFPIKMIIEIILATSFSSNECERTFSHYRLVKTDLRCRLTVETIDCLLNIALNSPNQEHLDFYTCIQYWKNLKNRYFI